MSSHGPVKEHTHKEIMIILSGLMTGMLLAALDQTIVSTALKSIVEDFNGLNHYTWVVTAYLLTSTASTPLYGKISDIYGRRIVFQFALKLLIAPFVCLRSFRQTQMRLIFSCLPWLSFSLLTGLDPFPVSLFLTT